MIPRAAVSLLAVVSTALAIAGCGRGDSGSDPSTVTTTTPSLGKAEFIALANAACREQRAGLEQRVVQFERRLKGREPERYGDVVHFVFLPTVEEEINQIEAVGTPRGERERLRVLLSAERSALGALVVQPRVASIAVAERQFNRSGRMLRAYGLGACANGTH